MKLYEITVSVARKIKYTLFQLQLLIKPNLFIDIDIINLKVKLLSIRIKKKMNK